MDPSGNPGQMPQTPPPAGWGQPGQPAGAWAAPAHAPAPNRSRFPLAIGGALLFILVVGGLYALNVLTTHPADSGKVVFSTDKPVTEMKGCSPANQVTSVMIGTPVYAWYVFSSRQGSETVSLAVTKNGAGYLPAYDMPISDTNRRDCFSDTSDLSELFEAGTYTFTLTSGGKTIAEGTLTITP